jgi:serine/threonine protein kinase
MTDPPKIPTLPEPPPEEYPRRFGNYTLLAPLARGGMGEVFLAKTGGVAGLEKRCVVKTLRPHLTDDREYVARFVDEARIVVQLGHRNICQVFDVGTVGERYYLAMEYIAGRDAKSLQSRAVGEQLDPGIAIHIACEVLEALDYAHRHQDAATGRPLELVHRDISPQNVMVSFEGEVKLIDFGLAASTVKHEQTQPNVVMGKLAYMAPEQVRGDKVDGRADLYAVAMCLYELLAGERFYEGRSPYEIWGIAAQGGFRPRKWDTLPPALRAVLDRALASNPAERFSTGLEMRAALESYRFEHGLRGDGPALREQMHQYFQPEIEENRRLLQLLANTKSGDSGPLPAAAPTEPTMSIARAISGPQVHKEATEPTQMLIQSTFGRPRRTRIAAVASAALVSAAVAFFVQDALRTQPIALPPRVVDAGVIAAVVMDKVVDAGSPADPVTVVDAGVVQLALLVDAGLADVEPEQAQNGKRPKKTDKRPDRKPAIEKPIEATPVQEDPPQTPTEATPPATPAPRFSAPMTKGERVQILSARCSKPCVNEVARRYAQKEWAASQASTDAFVGELRACWVEGCGLPP